MKEFLDRLKKSISYDPKTGVFTWKISKGRVKDGIIAGGIGNHGRLRIRFEKKDYAAHRLAWLITHGKWPNEVVDHIDGNPLNNRINNLRDVSRSVNMQNQRKANIDNKTGCLGVTYREDCKKFQAQITINGKQTYLGVFETSEQAHAVYLFEKRKHHEGCTI